MNVVIKIRRADSSAPAGKLADAELHFEDGLLAGLKLVGFAVWARRDGTGCTVSFPARQFVVHGERRNFALLRAVGDLAAQQALRSSIMESFQQRAAEDDARSRA
jgi:hypothetical protein